MTCPGKRLPGFLYLMASIIFFGCASPSVVQLLEKDNIALKKLATSNNIALSASEIIERTQANGKLRETSRNLPVFSFLRKVTTAKPNDKNPTANKKTKIYRAYTNNRDQILIKVDGREPTEKEIEEDRKDTLKRQRQYLDRNDKNKSEKIISNNIEIYRDKFIPRLIGSEQVSNRSAYIIQMVPNTDHRLKNPTADRIMNQMLVKLWVDQEDFQLSRMEAKIVEPVKMVAGVIGTINSIHVRLEQKRLTPKIWTDLKVETDFDIRIVIANFTFKMTSQSSEFELLPANK